MRTLDTIQLNRQKLNLQSYPKPKKQFVCLYLRQNDYYAIYFADSNSHQGEIKWETFSYIFNKVIFLVLFHIFECWGLHKKQVFICIKFHIIMITKSFRPAYKEIYFKSWLN